MDSSTYLFTKSFLIYGCCCDHILKRHSGRIEDRDFIRRSTSGFYPGNDLAEFTMHMLFRHQVKSNGVVQLSNGRRLFHDVDHCLVPDQERRIQFLFSLTVSSDGCYKSSRLHVVLLEKKLTRRCAGDADVTELHGFSEVAG